MYPGYVWDVWDLEILEEDNTAGLWMTDDPGKLFIMD